MATSVNDHVYRIAYEAFAKFSNKLSNCRNLDDIGQCFRINLKYLFNFHVFRASFFREGIYIHLTVSRNNVIVETCENPCYLPHENILIKKAVPLKMPLSTIPGLPDYYYTDPEEQGELWGWHFKQYSANILISLVSSRSKIFTQRDIVLLKLVAENLESKLLELCLFNEIESKNNKLNNALVTIREKNTMINTIVDQQKEIIRERTREVEEKNKRLIEVALLNAHNVREPLSRILGLISLIDYEDNETVINEIIPKIQTSSSDLDEALQKVINKASLYSKELKA